MKIPDKIELAGQPPYCLDGKELIRNFLGKDIDQMINIFKKKPLTKDFTFMAPHGLNYYLIAALEYLKSEDSKGDWEFAHGIVCSLYCQVLTSLLTESSLMSIKKVSDYCDQYRKKFNIEPKEKLFDGYIKEINRKVEQTQSTQPAFTR